MESKARTANIHGASVLFLPHKALFLPWQGHNCGCEASQPGKHLFCWYVSEGLPLPHLSDAMENTGADVLLPPPAPGYIQHRTRPPTRRPSRPANFREHVVCGSGTASTTAKHAQATLHPHHVCSHGLWVAVNLKHGGASSTTLACVAVARRSPAGAKGRRDETLLACTYLQRQCSVRRAEQSLCM